jgi:hypothetical protein
MALGPYRDGGDGTSLKTTAVVPERPVTSPALGLNLPEVRLEQALATSRPCQSVCCGAIFVRFSFDLC